jgi:hypothetical protein
MSSRMVLFIELIGRILSSWTYHFTVQGLSIFDTHRGTLKLSLANIPSRISL